MSVSDTLVGIVMSGSCVDVTIYPDDLTISFSGDLSSADTIADHLRPLAPDLVVVEDGVATPLAGMLYDAGFPVVMVHARHARLAGDGPERARMLARFAGGIRPEFRKDARELSEWVACSRGQMALIEAEKKRLTRVSGANAGHIQANIAHLERELGRMGEALSGRVLSSPIWRVRDHLLVYEGEARKSQEPAKRRPLPYVPYLHAWMRPHLRKAARWSLLGHLLFFLVCCPIILRLIPEQRPHRTVRLLRYSNLMPPPSLIAEKGPAPEAQSPPAVPPKAVVGKEYVFQSTVKARRTGMPVAVKNAAVPEKEEWKPSGQEFPADEDLVVRKSSFHEARSGVSVRQDMSSQRQLAGAPPPVPEERRAPNRPEQGGRQRVTLRLSILGGYAGVSGKIAYIQRTIGDMDRASFSFRDAAVDAVKREARVRFENGRTFAVYFGSDWKLGRIEMDMESGASDRDREAEALRAIDFLERALKSQSS